MEYINGLMEMNNWTATGLIAGFAFGFWLGCFFVSMLNGRKRRN